MRTTKILRTDFLVAALSGAIGLGFVAAQADEDIPSDAKGSGKNPSTMKILIKVENKTLAATLEDNGTSRDFVSLLPLTLTLKNYGSTEKISYLPRKLPVEGAPPGFDPDVGDVTYYAPWGNLAIFYKDFGYSDGLIKLGKIDGDVGVLRTTGELHVVIDVADPAVRAKATSQSTNPK